VIVPLLFEINWSQSIIRPRAELAAGSPVLWTA